jgi:hypothetical protein
MNITVKDEIKIIISQANKLLKYSTQNISDFELKKYYMRKEFETFIRNDFMKRNPEDMMNEYVEYFKDKKLLMHQIAKGTSFFRARIGYETLIGSEGDHDREFIIPYNKCDIFAPPPLISIGARFNRDGISYLYLSDEIETCLAEVHIQVGQICSVGEFICQQDVNFIDLTYNQDDLEIALWTDLLTQPIHSDVKSKYNITRFLADVLKQINGNGLFFKSVQSTGNNIVSFNKGIFELKTYSERTYIAKKIKYDFEPFKDAVAELSERKSFDSLLNINDDYDEKQEQKFNYLEECIEKRRNEI